MNQVLWWVVVYVCWFFMIILCDCVCGSVPSAGYVLWMHCCLWLCVSRIHCWTSECHGSHSANTSWMVPIEPTQWHNCSLPPIFPSSLCSELGTDHFTSQGRGASLLDHAAAVVRHGRTRPDVCCSSPPAAQREKMELFGQAGPQNIESVIFHITANPD